MQRWRSAYTLIAFGFVSLLIPFLNYGVRGDLGGGDVGIAWALPAEQLRHVAGVYIPGPGLGYNGAAGLAAAFPALALAAFLHGTGLPTPIVERLIIALYFFVAMSGAFALFRILVPEDRVGLWPATLAALLYGVNRYTVLLYSTAQTYFPLVYSALPWLVYGVVDGCERRPGRGIAIIVAALIWAGGAGSNPALFGVAVCAVATGAVLELAQGTPFRRVLAVSGCGAALGLACCAWWLFPLPSTIGSGLETVSASNVPVWVQWMSERSSFFNLFRLDGYTSQNTFAFGSWYGSPLGSVLGYVPLAFALAGFGTFRRRLSAAALVLFAVVAFLSKGVHPPFGWIYTLLLERVPGFSIFRSPYVKWIGLEALLLSLLFLLGTAGLAARLQGTHAWRRWAIAGGLLVALCLFSWPAFSGRMLAPRSKGEGYISTLPHDYERVAEIVRTSQRGTGRTVIFNDGLTPYPVYTWGYFGQDPLEVVLPSPATAFDSLLPMAPYMSAHALAAALQALGVEFVAVHKDVLNSIPSPQPSVLVASHEAFLVYRSSALDLYRLRRPSAPLVSALDWPLITKARVAGSDERRIFEFTPRHLDPNVGFLASEIPLQVIAAEPGAPVTPAIAQRFGWVRDLTDERKRTPSQTALAFVRPNPLWVQAAPSHCAANPGLNVSTPSRWRFGDAALPAVATTLCLVGPWSGALRVAAWWVSDPLDQFSLINGVPLALGVLEVARPRGFAERKLQRGLPFAFRLSRAATTLDFLLPLKRYKAPFYAVVRTPAGDLAGSTVANSSGELLLRFDPPLPAHRPFLLFLKNQDLATYVALQGVQRLPFNIGARFGERKWLTVDQRIFAPTPVRAGAQPDIDSRQIAPKPPKNVPRRLAVTWVPNDANLPATWHIDRDVLSLSSSGVPTELHATPRLDGTIRYRLSLWYRATGYAEVWIRANGMIGNDVTHLLADNRWRFFQSDVLSQIASGGPTIIRLRSSAGHLEVRQPELGVLGPSGIVLGWQQRTPLGGRVQSVARPFPWLIDAIVEDCTPCMLRAGIAQPAEWQVKGARILATFTSQGVARGPWEGITTGAATWLLDAGPGTRHLRFIFAPVLTAIGGLVIAFLAAIVSAFVGLFVRRRIAPLRSFESSPSRAQTPYRAALLLLSVTCLCLGLIGSVTPALGEIAADALWYAIIALSLGTSIFASVRRTT